jgi:hypothetical protein
MALTDLAMPAHTGGELPLQFGAGERSKPQADERKDQRLIESGKHRSLPGCVLPLGRDGGWARRSARLSTQGWVRFTRDQGIASSNLVTPGASGKLRRHALRISVPPRPPGRTQQADCGCEGGHHGSLQPRRMRNTCAASLKPATRAGEKGLP